MLPPNELEKREFAKSVRGYNSAEVDEHINFIIEKYTELYRENNELEKKLRTTQSKLDAIKKDEESIRAALINAQKASSTIINEANERAEVVLRATKTNCEKILSDFRSDIKRECDTLLALRSIVVDFKSNLFSTYNKHIEIIEDIKTEIEGLNELNITEDAFARRVIDNIKQDLLENIKKAEKTKTEPEQKIQAEILPQEEPKIIKEEVKNDNKPIITEKNDEPEINKTETESNIKTDIPEPQKIRNMKIIKRKRPTAYIAPKNINPIPETIEENIENNLSEKEETVAFIQPVITKNNILDEKQKEPELNEDNDSENVFEDNINEDNIVFENEKAETGIFTDKNLEMGAKTNSEIEKTDNFNDNTEFDEEFKENFPDEIANASPEIVKETIIEPPAERVIIKPIKSGDISKGVKSSIIELNKLLSIDDDLIENEENDTENYNKYNAPESALKNVPENKTEDIKPSINQKTENLKNGNKTNKNSSDEIQFNEEEDLEYQEFLKTIEDSSKKEKRFGFGKNKNKSKPVPSSKSKNNEDYDFIYTDDTDSQ